MKALTRVAQLVLSLVLLCALTAPWLAPKRYDEPFRESISTTPSREFPLGTDELGRDRFSRLLYATAISAVLAPAAALTSICLGLLLATLAPLRSQLLRFPLSIFTTLTLSIPWIFPFILLRAVLPLNTSPATSILLTFALIGVAGWAYPGRVLAGTMRDIADSDWLLLARASGIPAVRIFTRQIWPHLRAVCLAQFRTLIPAYILSEASLGLLGLGVAEPLPSWGNMLMELQYPSRIQANPAILAPLGLLIAVMVCLEILGNRPQRIS